MNNSIITNYILKNETSHKALSCFVKEIVTQKTQQYTFAKLRTKVIYIPFFPNGYVNIVKMANHFLINVTINLFPFMSHSLSSQLKFFYLYVTILHEIEHIELVLNANTNFTDYPRALAILEIFGKRYHLSFTELLENFFKNSKKKYQRNITSSLELECIYQSIQKAIPLFREYLSEKEKDQISLMSASLHFLRKHLEIGYLTHSIPYNKFMHSFINFQKKHETNVELLDDEYPFLQNIFDHNGKLKGFEQIYKNITPKNKELLDSLLFHIFLYSNIDFSSIFCKSNEIKKYMENLVNLYYENFVEFIENRFIGEIFADEEILNDNEIMKLKNINYLNTLIEKYHMECSIGIMTHSV